MSVTAPAGFVAAGVSSGIKSSGDLDLSLVATADGRAVPAAGVFTRNLMTAAPVLVSRHHLVASGGHAAAVVMNSGNANAATGREGRAHAEASAAAVAAEVGCATREVLVGSTGLIGIPLPIDALLSGVPAAVARLAATPDAGAVAAEALRTTDTVRKEASAVAGSATVGGMAKGAAMLAPSMATMLAVLTTDAEADPATLQRVLDAGVEGSFNSLIVDGCTSTNDTVVLLASGAAGPVPEAELAAAVADVCASLATQMAEDAEGATKVVRLHVAGAATDEEARRGAEQVARSVLCRCSWYGCDPYWGRLASELGSAGIEFDQERIAVAYGDTTVAAGGVEIPHDVEAVATHMAARHLTITCDLGLGPGRATILTNDLTHAYVDENMGTS